MPKILYIAHFSSSSGWGIAALNNVLALDSVGANVTPRRIVLNNATSDFPDRFLELESQQCFNPDIVIQHVLPHHMAYFGPARHVAYAVYENRGQLLNNWPAKINMMDELWVPSTFTRSVFKECGVTIPTKIVPHTFDQSVYTKTYEKISYPHLNGNFIFYTIADLNKRKNLGKLIQGFHLAFTPNEPVRLMIKSNKYELGEQKSLEVIRHECNLIKQQMKLYKNIESYSPEFVITKHLTDHEVMRLHATGDVYVNTSHSEAFCQPLYDSMAMGKRPVFPDRVYDYISEKEGYPVPTHDDCCLGCTDTFPELATARELWTDLSAHDVATALRVAYEDASADKKIKAGKKRANDYSYEKIGGLMKSLLEQPEDK